MPQVVSSSCAQLTAERCSSPAFGAAALEQLDRGMGGEQPPGLGVYYIQALMQSFVEKSTWTGYLSWAHSSEVATRRATGQTTVGNPPFCHNTVHVMSTARQKLEL